MHGRRHVKTEAEIGAMCLPAKEGQGYQPWPEASWEAQTGFPQNLQKESTLPTPWFQTSGLQNCETVPTFLGFTPASLWSFTKAALGNPWWLSGKEFACQCRRHGFDPWVGKIPWRRKWLSTPVFLPAKSHGQRSLASYSPWGRIGHGWATK